MHTLSRCLNHIEHAVVSHPFQSKKSFDVPTARRVIEPQVPTTATTGRDGYADPLEHFDTGGLRMLEDSDPFGFDPYGHERVGTATRAKQPRTDLRALSAQILAERARKEKAE